jgi:hypothetical protein
MFSSMAKRSPPSSLAGVPFPCRPERSDQPSGKHLVFKASFDGHLLLAIGRHRQAGRQTVYEFVTYMGPVRFLVIIDVIAAVEAGYFACQIASIQEGGLAGS